MKYLARITLSAALIAIGLATIFFALPLVLESPDWIDIGGFIILAIIGGMIGSGGVQVALGANVSDVLSELFRGLGR